jgi:hypothetical protein
MEYLRGSAVASAMGLYVICRYLNAHSDGRTEPELRKALEVLRSAQGDSDVASGVLTASLAVGQSIGALTHESSTSPWLLDPVIGDVMSTANWRWEGFRGFLVARMMEQGTVQSLETGKAPDLIRGLTWFMQQNPLSPPSLSWEGGPYQLMKALNFDAIERSEQWRPFGRWAVALGLARASESANVLIPDASTAIGDQIPHLPRAATATEWLSALRDRLPALGSNSMLEQLPSGGREWATVPPGLALGLLKLESAGVLTLEPSDDAADVVPLGLGATTRQVGRIIVEGD